MDSRLADPLVLILAAKRRHAKRQVPDWRMTEGLAALLDAARSLPRREPFDLEGVDTTSGLGKLLKEARQKGGDRGA